MNTSQFSAADVEAEFDGPEGQRCECRLTVKPAVGRPGFIVEGVIEGLGLDRVKFADKYVEAAPGETDSGPDEQRLIRLLIDWIERGEL